MNRKVQISILSALVAGVGAFLVAASQGATYGDESWYILAAQLINAGKRPYLDFFYQHPPLDILLTAGWMRAFGQTWRSVHPMSAFLLGIVAALIGAYVFIRFDSRNWRLGPAACAAILFGSNVGLKMAVLSTPWALSILFIFAAFLLTVRVINRPQFPAWWAGLFAGLAVATSLLNGIIAPLLLVWLALQLPASTRLKQCVSYVLGGLVAALPIAWFALRAWPQMLFDVVTFHVKYRTLSKFWTGKNVLLEDLKLYASVLESTQGLLLIVLSKYSTIIALPLFPRLQPAAACSLQLLLRI